jgi:hypothetical protein
MHPIGRGGDEIKSLVETSGFLILRMHREGTDAGNIGRLEGALHCVPQKRLANALAMPAAIHRQARKQHNRHRVARQSLGQTLGGFFWCYVADSESVSTDRQTSASAPLMIWAALVRTIFPYSMKLASISTSGICSVPRSKSERHSINVFSRLRSWT